jgi:predicted CoA-binding protein
MTSKTLVDEFLSQKTLAVVGVSRNKNKFGNSVFKELKQKGYEVYPVNPKAEQIDGERVYPSLKELPKEVGGVVVVVPPKVTEQIVRDAAEAGIKRVWMQQGAESKEAIRYCEEQGIRTINRECILMFAEPAAFYHKLHRWFWGLFGKLPK